MSDLTGRVVQDEAGFPVLLAEVPDIGIPTARKTGSEGGNPLHDKRSGKFAPGSGGPPPKESVFPNVDPIEYARMMDAVRDAAREFDAFDIGDIKEFLAGRARNPAQVDVEQFMRLVREQTKTDIVDILDQQFRSSGILPRGRRKVRVQAPRGYTQRTLRGMEPEEIAEIMHRLEARGHEREDIDKFFDKRVGNDEAKERRDGIAASDQWEGEVIDLYEYADGGPQVSPQEVMQFAAAFASEIVKKLPAPVVHVQPNIIVEAQKQTQKRVIRDEKGLIVGVEDVESAS